MAITLGMGDGLGWVGFGLGLGQGLVSYAIARWPRWTANNLHISRIELHPEK